MILKGLLPEHADRIEHIIKNLRKNSDGAFTSVVGTIALGGGAEGWLRVRATIFERALLIFGGGTLAYPGWSSDLIGVIITVAVLVCQSIRPKLTVSAKVNSIK